MYYLEREGGGLATFELYGQTYEIISNYEKGGKNNLISFEGKYYSTMIDLYYNARIDGKTIPSLYNAIQDVTFSKDKTVKLSNMN